MGDEITLLTTGEVARRLKLSGQGVHNLVAGGKIHPFSRTTNGGLVFTASEVERVRLARKAASTAALKGKRS